MTPNIGNIEYLIGLLAKKEKGEAPDLDKFLFQPGRIYHPLGNTLQACVDVAGMILAAEPGTMVLWLLREMGLLDDIRPRLSQLLKEMGIYFQWESDRLVCVGVTVLFVLPFDLEHRLEGRNPTYIVDAYYDEGG